MQLCSSFSVIKYHKGVSYIDNRKNHIANEINGDLWWFVVEVVWINFIRFNAKILSLSCWEGVCEEA